MDINILLKQIDKDEFTEYKNSFTTDSNNCKNCNNQLIYNNVDAYECSNCGLWEYSRNSYINPYNKSNNYVRYRSGDRNRTLYNGSMTLYNDHEQIKKKTIVSMLQKKNMQSTDLVIPNEIIEEVSNEYIKISKIQLYRSNNKLLILSACIENAFISNNKIIKAKRIANFMNLNNEGYNEGHLILKKQKIKSITDNDSQCIDYDKMTEINKQIDKTECVDRVSMFMTKFFEILNIDNKYYKSAIDIVNIANLNGIGISSVATTKCTGTIYFIIVKHKLAITKNQIEKETRTKKSTFTKYYNNLMKYIELFVELI